MTSYNEAHRVYELLFKDEDIVVYGFFPYEKGSVPFAVEIDEASRGIQIPIRFKMSRAFPLLDRLTLEDNKVCFAFRFKNQTKVYGCMFYDNRFYIGDAPFWRKE